MAENTSRRRFLKVAAATGALAGLNVTVLAQDQSEELILLGGLTRAWLGYRFPGKEGDDVPDNPTLTLQEGTTYTLMWRNVDGVGHNFAIQDADGNNLEVLYPLATQPEVFADANNTTADQNVSLEISDGNLTGVSADGNQTDGNATGDQQTTPEPVSETEIITPEGSVQAVQFTATSEMDQYICLVHPNTMVGDVEVESNGNGSDDGNGG